MWERKEGQGRVHVRRLRCGAKMCSPPNLIQKHVILINYLFLIFLCCMLCYVMNCDTLHRCGFVAELIASGTKHF